MTRRRILFKLGEESVEVTTFDDEQHTRMIPLLAAMAHGVAEAGGTTTKTTYREEMESL